MPDEVYPPGVAKAYVDAAVAAEADARADADDAIEAAYATVVYVDAEIAASAAGATFTGDATDVPVVDAGGLYTATQVEAALAEVKGLADAAAVNTAVVHNTGTETVAGVKTFSSAPVVPDASFTIAKTNALQTALDLKALDSAVVHNTGTETIAGAKTFSTAPAVPDASFAVAKLNMTGTPSSSTFARGDGTWQPPPSGGAAAALYIVVAAFNSSAQSKAAAALICSGQSGNATDDSLAIAALADGRPLLLMPGDYYFSTALNIALFNNQATGAVHGKAVVHLRDTLDIGFTCQGTTTSGRATLNAPASKGTTTITVVSSTNLVVGSIYNIVTTSPLSDSSADPNHTYQNFQGEWVEVAAKNVNGTTVTLKRPLQDSYTLTPTAPTFRLMTPVTDVRVTGIEFVGTGQAPTAANQKAFDIRHFVGVKIIDCGFYDLRNYGAYFRSGIDAEVTQCYGKRIACQKLFGGTVDEAGAMAGFFGVENARFVNNGGGQDCRHMVDFDGFSTEPPSRGCLVENNIAQDCYAAAFASHPGQVGLTVVGNVALRGGAGFIVRGTVNIVTGNTAIGPFNSTAIGGYASGYVIGDGNPSSNPPPVYGRHGIAGQDLVFTNNVFVGNRLATDTEGGGSGTFVSAVRVHDDLNNATITGNNFKGMTDHGLDIRSNRVWDVVIAGNSFTCDAQKANRYPINITPGETLSGNYQRDVKTHDNVLIGAPASNVFVHIDGPTSGTTSNQIKIHDNDLPIGMTPATFSGLFDATTVYLERNQGEVAPDARAVGAHPSQWTLKAFSGPPENYGQSQILTTGLLYTQVLWVSAGYISTLAVGRTTMGSGLTSGQTKMACFSPAVGGALLGTTADMSTDAAVAVSASTALTVGTLVTPFWWTGGYMRVGIWCVGTTPVTLARAGSPNLLLDWDAGNLPRYGVSSATYTTTAPSVVPALTGSGLSFWFGVG